jgi:hypothetical protein
LDPKAVEAAYVFRPDLAPEFKPDLGKLKQRLQRGSTIDPVTGTDFAGPAWGPGSSRSELSKLVGRSDLTPAQRDAAVRKLWELTDEEAEVALKKWKDLNERQIVIDPEFTGDLERHALGMETPEEELISTMGRGDPVPTGPGRTSLKAPIEEIEARQMWLSPNPGDEAMADVLRSGSDARLRGRVREWTEKAPIAEVRRFVDNLDEVSGMQDTAAKARVLIRELADTNPRAAEEALRNLAADFSGDSPMFDIIPALERDLGRPRDYWRSAEVAEAAKRFKK